MSVENQRADEGRAVSRDQTLNANGVHLRRQLHLLQYQIIKYLVLLPAPAAFPAGVDPNRGSEETVRSRDQLKVQACCDQLKA